MKSLSWADSINQEANRLRAEGWRTSGDCAVILKIHRATVAAKLGEPGRVLRRGGKTVKMWHIDHVQAVADGR